MGVIAIGLSAVVSLNYWGPFRWASEVQLSQFDGSYSSSVSFFFVLLLFVLPAAALGHWLDIRAGADGRARMLALIYPLARFVYRADLVLSVARRHLALSIVALGIFAIAAGAGWKFYLESVPVVPIRTVHVADVLSGEYAAAGYVCLTHAQIVPQPTYVFVEKRRRFDRETRTAFFPVIKQGQQQLQAVILFAAVPESESSTEQVGEIVGELVRNGLPGPIRERFQARLAIAKEHFVIHARQPPTDVARAAVFVMYVGVYAVVVGTLWCAITMMRARLRRH